MHELLGVAGELGVVEGLSRLFFVGIDLSGPPLDGNPATGNGTGGLLSLGPNCGRNEDGECDCERGTVDETHGVSFR